eukprot:scaffold84933_cov55-Phaeocystis_antarctica.AAC.4
MHERHLEHGLVGVEYLGEVRLGDCHQDKVHPGHEHRNGRCDREKEHPKHHDQSKPDRDGPLAVVDGGHHVCRRRRPANCLEFGCPAAGLPRRSRRVPHKQRADDRDARERAKPRGEGLVDDGEHRDGGWQGRRDDEAGEAGRQPAGRAEGEAEGGGQQRGQRGRDAPPCHRAHNHLVRERHLERPDGGRVRAVKRAGELKGATLAAAAGGAAQAAAQTAHVAKGGRRGALVSSHDICARTEARRGALQAEGDLVVDARRGARAARERADRGQSTPPPQRTSGLPARPARSPRRLRRRRHHHRRTRLAPRRCHNSQGSSGVRGWQRPAWWRRRHAW